MLSIPPPFMNLGVYEQGAAFHSTDPYENIEQIKTYVRKLRKDGYIDVASAQMAEDLDPDSDIEDLRKQVGDMWFEIEG